VELFPRPSFEGLPGAPSGSRWLTFLGTKNVQLAQESFSSSTLPLYRLVKAESLVTLGKYGLFLLLGDVGLVGGVSKGDDSCGSRLAKAIWAPSYSALYG
jgi:hypothetical protein